MPVYEYRSLSCAEVLERHRTVDEADRVTRPGATPT